MLRVGSGRTRCLQLAVGVTLANLLLSTTLVYLSTSTTSSSHGNQERLLLSVEYPGRFVPNPRLDYIALSSVERNET